MDIITKHKENRLQTVIIIGGVCFFVGRACFVPGLAPVGAALLLTLIMYNAGRLETWQKVLIAGAFVIIVQSIVFIAVGKQDAIKSISEILQNGCLASVFCGIFEIVIGLWSGKKVNADDDLVVLSVSAVIMLMIIGVGAQWLLFPMAAVLVVFCSYVSGISPGLTCGFAAGMLIYICEESTMQVIWLLLIAIASGLFKGSSRLPAGIVVCAMAIAAAKFEILPAGVLLMLMPDIVMVRVEAALSELFSAGKAGDGSELTDLSILFSSLDNPRSRLAYEFKAMSQLHQQKSHPAKPRKLRQQQAAAAAYSGTSERCGDSGLWANLPDGRFALALSDGMGKGEAAAGESNLAVTSVIKMLRAGLDEELVLKLLNSISMLDTGRENFSTMDLGILDPDSGEMRFYKVGAAPSLVKRKDSIEILAAPAMPMGVIDPYGVQSVSTIVRPGDQVIMMSDGIVDSMRGDTELKWLQQVLQRIKSKSPQTVCDLILKEAASNYGDREKDDMFVASFRVR